MKLALLWTLWSAGLLALACGSTVRNDGGNDGRNNGGNDGDQAESECSFDVDCTTHPGAEYRWLNPTNLRCLPSSDDLLHCKECNQDADCIVGTCSEAVGECEITCERDSNCLTLFQRHAGAFTDPEALRCLPRDEDQPFTQSHCSECQSDTDCPGRVCWRQTLCVDPDDPGLFWPPPPPDDPPTDTGTNNRLETQCPLLDQQACEQHVCMVVLGSIFDPQRRCALPQRFAGCSHGDATECDDGLYHSALADDGACWMVRSVCLPEPMQRVPSTHRCYLAPSRELPLPPCP